MEGLYEKIKNCIECGSKDDRQPTFCGYDKITRHKVALIFEIPGGDTEHSTFFNYVKFLENNKMGNPLLFWRYGTVEWMFNRKKISDICRFDMLRAILIYLSENEIINLQKRYKLSDDDEFYMYLTDGFVDDVYFTDIVKCRPRNKQIIMDEKGTNAVSRCSNKFLMDELNFLEELQVIITFGENAIKAFQNIESFNLVKDTSFANPEIISVSKPKRLFHGNIYCLEGTQYKSPYIISSVHPSRYFRLSKEVKENVFPVLKKAINHCSNLILKRDNKYKT